MGNRMQEDIKKRQVEEIFSATMFAYTGLLDLDGEHYEMTENSGKFKGTAKVTLNTAAELGNLVNHMLGLTLKFDEKFDVKVDQSKVYDGHVSKETIEKDFESYSRALSTEQNGINDVFDSKKENTGRTVKKFMLAMNTLRESYVNGDKKEITQIVDEVKDSAIWGTNIPIGSLLETMNGMENIAYKAGSKGFEKAYEIARVLREAQKASKVLYCVKIGTSKKTGNPIVNIPLGIKGSPNKQVYKGTLDSGIIADELMRNH